MSHSTRYLLESAGFHLTDEQIDAIDATGYAPEICGWLSFVGGPPSPTQQAMLTTMEKVVEQARKGDIPTMGGKPSKGTKPDMRLSRNNPQAGKATPQSKVTKAVTPPVKKGK